MGKMFEMFKEAAEKNRKDTTIASVSIVGEDSRKRTASAVGRGLVGGALLGPLGTIAGVASAKNKKETTFKVTYESGRVEVVTCKNKSPEYKKYAKNLKD